ncbi:hypothetical protein KAI87_16595, partial [Myxococcota bacterium]|nr:hypothetical protein [Myxococcota bacterium]
MSCSGCSTDGPVIAYPDPPPAGGEIQTDVANLKIMQSTLDFLVENISVLFGDMATIDGGKAIFYLDEASLEEGGPIALRDGCIGEPDDPCTGETSHLSSISLDLNSIAENTRLLFLENDAEGRPGLRLEITDIELFMDLAIAMELEGMAPAACLLHDGPEGAALKIALISTDMRIALNESGTGLEVIAGELIVEMSDGTDDDMMNLVSEACDGVASECVDPVCAQADADCESMCNIIDLFAQLGDFAALILQPLIDGMGETLAVTLSEATAGMLADVPLDFTMELSLEDFLGALAAGSEPLVMKIGLASDALSGTAADPIGGLAASLEGGAAAHP